MSPASVEEATALSVDVNRRLQVIARLELAAGHWKLMTWIFLTLFTAHILVDLAAAGLVVGTMIDLRFRPLEKWSEKTRLEKKRNPFNTRWDRTLDILEYELKKVGARNILIEAGFLLKDIRNDGWPKGSAQPVHAGVILYFEGMDGPLRFPSGTYADWHANLHAIALTLVNLRAIDRYGVTLGHQQYAGFKALTAAPPAMTVEDAAKLIGGLAFQDPHLIVLSQQIYRDSYRSAAQKAHPDMKGGSQEMFVKLGEAKSVMDTHFNLGAEATA